MCNSIGKGLTKSEVTYIERNKKTKERKEGEEGRERQRREQRGREGWRNRDGETANDREVMKEGGRDR